MLKTFAPICSAAALAAAVLAGSASAGAHSMSGLSANQVNANTILMRAAQALPEISGTYSVEGVNPDGSAYSGTVNIKTEGEHYQFSWLIAGQAYNGVGVASGDTIVVEWGEKDPVIYNVGGDGVLKGKWDKEQATETLTRMR